jgi:hypothetical protein
MKVRLVGSQEVKSHCHLDEEGRLHPLCDHVLVETFARMHLDIQAGLTVSEVVSPAEFRKCAQL